MIRTLIPPIDTGWCLKAIPLPDWDRKRFCTLAPDHEGDCQPRVVSAAELHEARYAVSDSYKRRYDRQKA